MPWVVEAPGHLFLHCGLSRELEAGPEEQVEALRQTVLGPVPAEARRRDRHGDGSGSPNTRSGSGPTAACPRSPLPYPGKVQVTGHERVPEPDASPVRIRLDTSGGRGVLTACLLRSADARPEFIREPIVARG